MVKEDDYYGEDDGRSQFGRGSSGPCPKCPSRVTLHFPQQISGDVDVNFSTDVEGVVTVVHKRVHENTYNMDPKLKHSKKVYAQFV